MNFFSKLFRSRDKPQNLCRFGGWPFMFGKSAAGQNVNEFTAMQTMAVYACVRILAESIAGLPLHVYEYRGNGKERVPEHPLYFLLHDAPNPEMTSFIFRETSMIHLLLWGNSYAQILRDGRGRVVGLYPLLPNRMSVERNDAGEIIYTYTPMIDANPSFKDKGQIRLRREDVLHIRVSVSMALSAIRPSPWRRTPSASLWRRRNMARHFSEMVRVRVVSWSIQGCSKIPRSCAKVGTPFTAAR